MTMKLPPKRRAAKLKRGGSRAWAKLSKQVAKEEPICWLRLPGCTIRSTGADHYYPVKTHPQLEFVRSNCKGACAHCNLARRDTPVHLIPKLRAKMERDPKYRTTTAPSRKALGFFG